jgi:Flp pilus assembly protein TadD
MSRTGLRTWIALALLVTALAAVAMACFGPWAEPSDVREARRALASGRFTEADLLLARWLKSSPISSEAHLLKGRVALALGRLPEAGEELKRAHALGHPRQGLVLLQALIASKLGRHAEAEPALRQAFTEARRPDLQLDEALAKSYIETYDLARAAAVLDRWARDFPRDPKPYLWRAEVDSRNEKAPGAVLDDYREALRRDPALARARLGLAEELRKAHRTAEAAAEYDAYLALEPGDPAAHLGAGRNLLEQGDEAAATRHLERALALDPKNADVHKEFAEAALRRGDCTAALAHLDGAIALAPQDLPARHSRSLVLTRLGRTDEARAEQAFASRLRADLDRLNEARSRLVTSPHDRRAQVEIARWMFDHGHEEEGARWAERALQVQPDDSEVNRMLADYHQRRGEAGLANYYQLHVSSTPNSSPGEKRPVTTGPR